MENFVCGRNETYADIGETSTDHEYEVPIKKNEWIIMIEQGNIGPVEMLSYNINAQGGSTPAALAPPNAITPQTCNTSSSLSAGAVGEKGTVPSFIEPAFCF
jgi:hypothetical protein